MVLIYYKNSTNHQDVQNVFSEMIQNNENLLFINVCVYLRVCVSKLTKNVFGPL